jgi:hypothetical protein
MPIMIFIMTLLASTWTHMFCYQIILFFVVKYTSSVVLLYLESIMDNNKCILNKDLNKDHNKEVCSICIEILDRNHCMLDCKHCFHIDCIYEWIMSCRTKQISCPLCRKKLYKIKF